MSKFSHNLDKNKNYKNRIFSSKKTPEQQKTIDPPVSNYL